MNEKDIIWYYGPWKMERCWWPSGLLCVVLPFPG